MFHFSLNDDERLLVAATEERELLFHILKELKAMALDLSAVTAAISKVSADVDALITADAAVAKAVADATAQHQAQVATLVDPLTAISAKAEVMLAPPVTPTPAA